MFLGHFSYTIQISIEAIQCRSCNSLIVLNINYTFSKEVLLQISAEAIHF